MFIKEVALNWILKDSNEFLKNEPAKVNGEGISLIREHRLRSG